MQKDVEEIIKLLIKELSARFSDFQGIYIYGYYADGTNQPDDDIELVAIFDSEDKQKREIIWPIVGKIETDKNVYIDLHPIALEQFKKDEDFYNEVTENGVFFKV